MENAVFALVLDGSTDSIMDVVKLEEPSTGTPEKDDPPTRNTGNGRCR